MKTKVICPCCGCEIAIPNHEHAVSGIAIGADSNLGTIVLPMANKGELVSKANERINALRKAGVKGQFFAMGDGRISRFDVENGCVDVINDDDEIFNSIVNGGTIPNKHLFRQWVLAQVLRMHDNKIGYTASLHALGYRYQWKMLLNEIAMQKKFETTDPEYAKERRLLFDVFKVSCKMCYDYIGKFEDYIDTLKVRHCNGVPYKRIGTRNVYVRDIQDAIITPLYRIYSCKVCVANTTEELLSYVNEFVKQMIFVKSFRQCPEWVDAYKGAGAYYALKNLVLFHNIFIINKNDVKLRREEASDYLLTLANEYVGEGWRLMGVFRKVLSDNNVDIHAMRESWRKN